MSAGSEPVRQASQGRRTGVVLAAVLLVAGALLLWSAATAEGDFGLRGPRLAPVVVTAAWVVAAALYLIMQLRGEEQEDQDEEQEQPRPGWPAPLGVLAALAGFAIALEYAGFVVSAALFTVATARVLGSRNLLRDVIVAVVLPIAVYLAFTRLLDIFLPAGVFPL